MSNPVWSERITSKVPEMSSKELMDSFMGVLNRELDKYATTRADSHFYLIYGQTTKIGLNFSAFSLTTVARVLAAPSNLEGVDMEELLRGMLLIGDVETPATKIREAMEAHFGTKAHWVKPGDMVYLLCESGEVILFDESVRGQFSANLYDVATGTLQ